MEISWCLLSKYKSSSLLIIVMMMLLVSMIGWIQGLSIEEDERRALVEIKASLHEVSKNFYVDNILPTWVDDGGKYCDWERIKCDATSTYVTELSLRNMFSIDEEQTSVEYSLRTKPSASKIWALNASLFLHFEELTSLDLSMSFIGDTFVSTDISEFPALENLEILLLRDCGCYGTFQIQDTQTVSTLRKLEVLDLSINRFNKSLITSLRYLPASLRTLDLNDNGLSGSFPSQGLSHFSNLERLDLSFNYFDDAPSIEDCKSLKRMKKLESVSLGYNNFNKSIISCLSFLPSLNNLDLSYFYNLGSSLPVQELSSLRELKTLDLSFCGFESFPLNELPANLHGLEVLLLRGNSFSGTLPMKVGAEKL